MAIIVFVFSLFVHIFRSSVSFGNPNGFGMLFTRLRVRHMLNLRNFVSHYLVVKKSFRIVYGIRYQLCFCYNNIDNNNNNTNIDNNMYTMEHNHGY